MCKTLFKYLRLQSTGRSILGVGMRDGQVGVITSLASNCDDVVHGGLIIMSLCVHNCCSV